MNDLKYYAEESSTQDPTTNNPSVVEVSDTIENNFNTDICESEEIHQKDFDNKMIKKLLK